MTTLEEILENALRTRTPMSAALRADIRAAHEAEMTARCLVYGEIVRETIAERIDQMNKTLLDFDLSEAVDVIRNYALPPVPPDEVK